MTEKEFAALPAEVRRKIEVLGRARGCASKRRMLSFLQQAIPSCPLGMSHSAMYELAGREILRICPEWKLGEGISEEISPTYKR